MAKTYASFYIPVEEHKEPIPNPTMMAKIKNVLMGGLKDLFSRVPEDSSKKGFIHFFNAKKDIIAKIAEKITLDNSLEVTKLYATQAITRIVNSERITSDKMFECFFNMMAPELNYSLANMGYNSLKEMEVALRAGKVNVANFLEGLTNGIDALKKSNDYIPDSKYEYSKKYGVEIPIDVVRKIDYEYKNKVSNKKTEDDTQNATSVNPFDSVEITLHANINNPEGETWDVNYSIGRIINAMKLRNYITVRLGHEILEKCIIVSFKPSITNLYDFAFECKIRHFESNPNENKYEVQIATEREYELMGVDPGIRNAEMLPVFGGIFLPKNKNT